MSLATLDAVLQFLYGWMPLIAGLAGIWIWRRYGNLGWGLFGTIALLQLLGAYLWPAVALEPSSERVTWFTIALVAFWSAGIVQQVRRKLPPKLTPKLTPPLTPTIEGDRPEVASHDSASD